MQLKKLRLINFRNYKSVELEANRHLNFFLGKNGQGKSNLLEAIYYLANGVSYRAARDDHLVRWGEDHFFLSGEIEGNGCFKIEISFSLGGQKKAVVNGQKTPSLQKVREVFPVVIFTPEDPQIVKGAPAIRRNYLDHLLCILYPEYSSLLAGYQRALAQRNRLLRSGRGEGVEEWEEILSTTGAKIVAYRFKILPLLSAEIKKNYLSLGGERKLEVNYYSSVVFDEQPFFSLSPEVEYHLQQVSEKVRNYLQATLTKQRKKDYERGFTATGPHRDDLIFRLAGREARYHASQGEQRSIALALRLGQVTVLERELKKKPVLLLDDVFSELDSERRRTLIESLDLMSRQVFLTTTETSSVPREREILRYSSVWEIRNGQVYLKEEAEG